MQMIHLLFLIVAQLVYLKGKLYSGVAQILPAKFSSAAFGFKQNFFKINHFNGAKIYFQLNFF